VSYTYADDERPALGGVSFTIQPGQKIALVGRSGAGKSTVAQLLLRFVEPTAGRITVGEDDLSSIPPDDWRAQIAWVPQMPYLFAASVADNIRLAWPNGPLDAVIRAAQQAHADDFIRALPDGYDTLIGERGARLSGGQAQRIALARAFLKDVPLLILDEATSNLDPETETDIQAAIRTLMQDRTVLIIAHRLSTVIDADQIVVLDQGRVAQAGTHHDLSVQTGIYRQLVTIHEP
jgi:ATP-binding cassette subfamily C protein CydD